MTLLIHLSDWTWNIGMPQPQMHLSIFHILTIISNLTVRVGRKWNFTTNKLILWSSLIWILNISVAFFQQRRHVEYISLNLIYIQRLECYAFYALRPMLLVAAYKTSIEPKIPNSDYIIIWLTIIRFWNIFFTDDKVLELVKPHSDLYF